MWPLIVLVCGRRVLALICLVIMAGSLVLRFELAGRGELLAAYLSTPARMDALAVGALLAIVATEGARLHSLARFAAPAGAAAAAGLILIAIRHQSLSSEAHYVVTLGITGYALLFGALLTRVLVASPSSLLYRVLTGKVLTFFGQYSYGLYVIHVFLMYRIAEHVISGASFPSVHGSVLPGVIGFSLALLALSTVLAMASWHLLEQPFLKLKRYLGP